MTGPGLPAHTDVCILGAGPHGLAAAHHLRSADPGLTLTVLDPAGDWLSTWHEQFERAEITTLRSPVVHHPVHDPSALAQFVHRTRAPRSGLPYDAPTATAFARFCRSIVADAALPQPIPARVTSVRNVGDGLELTTDAGNLRTTHLVVATNPHRRVIPEWTFPLLGRRVGLVTYGLDVDLRQIGSLEGQRVAVVGGGLTAAHLACGAVARGADVELLARRRLRVKNFDTDPGWLGPKFLDGFAAVTDAAERLAIARAARGGGSIPPWMHDRLRTLAATGRLTIREAATVECATIDIDGASSLRLDTDDRVRADHVWIATGTECDIGALRCLDSLALDAPMLDGKPLVDSSLRLGPHPVYLMGRLATAALGPAAGNLWGAQRAAHRITEALTGVHLRGQSIATIPVDDAGA